MSPMHELRTPSRVEQFTPATWISLLVTTLDIYSKDWQGQAPELKAQLHVLVEFIHTLIGTYNAGERRDISGNSQGYRVFHVLTASRFIYAWVPWQERPQRAYFIEKPAGIHLFYAPFTLVD